MKRAGASRGKPATSEFVLRTAASMLEEAVRLEADAKKLEAEAKKLRAAHIALLTEPKEHAHA